MGAKRVQYQIVARQMAGKEVTGYYLQSMETGKQGFYTKEQIAYLVGRDQITNCTGQIYQDKLLLRGTTVSLDDLPIVNANNELRNADGLGRIKRGTSAEEAINQLNIVGLVTKGRNTLGYILQNSAKATQAVKRETVLIMARDGKIGNARTQMYKGQMILKGINVDISALPKYAPEEVASIVQR